MIQVYRFDLGKLILPLVMVISNTLTDTFGIYIIFLEIALNGFYEFKFCEHRCSDVQDVGCALWVSIVRYRP